MKPRTSMCDLFVPMLPSSRGSGELRETDILTADPACRGGFSIALDDFGTGFASLSHLHQFPIDTIKIDRSFVLKLTHDAGAQAIIRAVLNLGKSMGLKVIAEGVETREQHAQLVRQHCQFAQGYLYSQAVPALRVPKLLHAWKPQKATTPDVVSG